VFKKNTHEFFLALIVVAAVSFLVGSMFTSNTGAVTSVSSSIDEFGPSAGYFEVPSGSVAGDFRSVMSDQGKAWGIYRAEMINGKYVPESYDPLYHTTFGDVSGFKLGPGKYMVLVDGWKGAEVDVYYTLE